MWGIAPQLPYCRLVKYYNSPRLLMLEGYLKFVKSLPGPAGELLALARRRSAPGGSLRKEAEGSEDYQFSSQFFRQGKAKGKPVKVPYWTFPDRRFVRGRQADVYQGGLCFLIFSDFCGIVIPDMWWALED